MSYLNRLIQRIKDNIFEVKKQGIPTEIYINSDIITGALLKFIAEEKIVDIEEYRMNDFSWHYQPKDGKHKITYNLTLRQKPPIPPIPPKTEDKSSDNPTQSSL